MGRDYTHYGRDQFNFENVYGDVNIQPSQPTVTGIPNNLPFLRATAFVGRAQEMEELHQLLSTPLAIVALQGIGGIGKSELALQYARLYQQQYKGGICWLRAQTEVGTQIVEFASTVLGLPIRSLQDLDLMGQLRYCWSHWNVEGIVLLICDNVLEYESIQPYLPGDNRFRVLLTTRFRLSPPVQLLEIDQLSEQVSLELLKSLAGSDRIEGELEAARSLCEQLGYLPLALELMGRYLTPRPDLQIVDLLKQLEAQSLSIQALEQVEAGMTAQLGLLQAFELSWQQLSPASQQLSYLLSLFTLSPVKWEWVKQVCQEDEEAPEIEGWLLEEEGQLEEAKLDLYRSGLLKRVAEQTYQLHQITHEFFRLKGQQFDAIEELKGRYCWVLAELSREIPDSPTIGEIEQIAPLIPHLEFAAEHLLESYQDEDLFGAFVGIFRLYKGQGLYRQTIPWSVKGLKVMHMRLGEEHPDVAATLNNLALLYKLQGRYEEAESLYLKALSIKQQQLGEEYPSVATTLNDLAALYDSQGRYGEAEPLYLKALTIRQQQLGEEHPEVASTLNNLALLYGSQGRYEEAESLYLKALSIWQQQLGEEHPEVASTLNNLAVLYYSQGRYDEAEPLYQKALAICQQQLGEEHPHVATTLNNLANLYYSQGRYGEAEPLYQKALAICQQQLGEEHPSVATTLNNLALLYYSQGRYEDGEPLYLKALAIRQQQLGEEHPDVATTLNDLAALYDSQGRYAKAEPLFLKATSIAQQALGDNHPNTIQIRNNLQILQNRKSSFWNRLKRLFS